MKKSFFSRCAHAIFKRVLLLAEKQSANLEPAFELFLAVICLSAGISTEKGYSIKPMMKC